MNLTEMSIHERAIYFILSLKIIIYCRASKINDIDANALAKDMADTMIRSNMAIYKETMGFIPAEVGALQTAINELTDDEIRKGEETGRYVPEPGNNDSTPGKNPLRKV
jgi:hypothetical protein